MGAAGGATTYQAYPGTPSHLASLKPAKANASTTPSTSFFVSEDMRLEIMNKNALTLMHHEPEQFPGREISSNLCGKFKFICMYDCILEFIEILSNLCGKFK